MIDTCNVKICLLPFGGRVGGTPNVVISEEKCKTLHYQMMSIFSLAFDGMVDVAESEGEVDHRVIGI